MESAGKIIRSETSASAFFMALAAGNQRSCCAPPAAAVRSRPKAHHVSATAQLVAARRSTSCAEIPFVVPRAQMTRSAATEADQRTCAQLCSGCLALRPLPAVNRLLERLVPPIDFFSLVSKSCARRCLVWGLKESSMSTAVTVGQQVRRRYWSALVTSGPQAKLFFISSSQVGPRNLKSLSRDQK